MRDMFRNIDNIIDPVVVVKETGGWRRDIVVVHGGGCGCGGLLFLSTLEGRESSTSNNIVATGAATSRYIP